MWSERLDASFGLRQRSPTPTGIIASPIAGYDMLRWRAAQIVNWTPCASREPFSTAQAFGDRLGRLQGRLGQCRILDDLALNPRCLPVQHVTHGLQLGDELVDLLH